jgi:AcrR family transcriptional regulator
VREEQARRTRLAILDAARLLFTEQGYAATTIAQIAAAARVAVDTVYASVGTKPVLMRLLGELRARPRRGRGRRRRVEPEFGRVLRPARPRARLAPDRFARWLGDTWCRLFLARPRSQ